MHVQLARGSVLLLGALLVCGGLSGLVGCGGAGSAESMEGDAGEGVAVKEPSEMTPVELGEAIGAVYVRSLEGVVALLEDLPEPDVVRPELQRLKDDAVAELVALGRGREALGAADRATVDGKVRMAVRSVPSDVFTAYAEGQNHYLGTDRELADLVASFNILTQYANFELLEQQAPDEAERLGIQ